MANRPGGNNNPSGSRRKTDPALARKRRLNGYPTECWDILNATVKQQEYSKTFSLHHDAVAFCARFNRFRLDAIEDNVTGALELRDVGSSGTNSDGTLFNARDSWAPGPYTITWRYRGPIRSTEIQPESSIPASELPPDILQPPPIEVRRPDAFEEAMRKHSMVDSPQEPQKDSSHTCVEWNEYDACVECGKPKDLT